MQSFLSVGGSGEDGGGLSSGLRHSLPCTAAFLSPIQWDLFSACCNASSRLAVGGRSQCTVLWAPGRFCSLVWGAHPCQNLRPPCLQHVSPTCGPPAIGEVPPTWRSWLSGAPCTHQTSLVESDAAVLPLLASVHRVCRLWWRVLEASCAGLGRGRTWSHACAVTRTATQVLAFLFLSGSRVSGWPWGLALLRCPQP